MQVTWLTYHFSIALQTLWSLLVLTLGLITRPGQLKIWKFDSNIGDISSIWLNIVWRLKCQKSSVYRAHNMKFRPTTIEYHSLIDQFVTHKPDVLYLDYWGYIIWFLVAVQCLRFDAFDSMPQIRCLRFDAFDAFDSMHLIRFWLELLKTSSGLLITQYSCKALGTN